MTINRVCRFDGFPLNLVRTFTDMQQKCVGKFFYLNTFFFFVAASNAAGYAFPGAFRSLNLTDL